MRTHPQFTYRYTRKRSFSKVLRQFSFQVCGKLPEIIHRLGMKPEIYQIDEFRKANVKTRGTVY